MRCREAVIAFLVLKRRHFFQMDRYLVQYIACIIWSTRKHLGWAAWNRIITIETQYRVRENEIRVYSAGRDNWVKFGEHPIYGWNYTILSKQRYVIEQVLSARTMQMVDFVMKAVCDEVFLFTKNSLEGVRNGLQFELASKSTSAEADRWIATGNQPFLGFQ